MPIGLGTAVVVVVAPGCEDATVDDTGGFPWLAGFFGEAICLEAPSLPSPPTVLSTRSENNMTVQ